MQREASSVMYSCIQREAGSGNIHGGHMRLSCRRLTAVQKEYLLYPVQRRSACAVHCTERGCRILCK